MPHLKFSTVKIDAFNYEYFLKLQEVINVQCSNTNELNKYRSDVFFSLCNPMSLELVSYKMCTWGR